MGAASIGWCFILWDRGGRGVTHRDWKLSGDAGALSPGRHKVHSNESKCCFSLSPQPSKLSLSQPLQGI